MHLLLTDQPSSWYLYVLGDARNIERFVYPVSCAETLIFSVATFGMVTLSQNAACIPSK